jgi:hypothetical protein
MTGITKNCSKEWTHWLVVNVPGVDGELKYNQGLPLFDYVGAGPEKEEGMRSFAFVL